MAYLRALPRPVFTEAPTTATLGGGIGDFLKKAAGVVLPIVGGIVGGPAGAALGSALGGAVGGGGGAAQTSPAIAPAKPVAQQLLNQPAVPGTNVSAGGTTISTSGGAGVNIYIGAPGPAAAPPQQQASFAQRQAAPSPARARQQLSAQDTASLQKQRYLAQIDGALVSWRSAMASAEQRYQQAYAARDAAGSQAWGTYYNQLATGVAQLESQRFQYLS